MRCKACRKVLTNATSRKFGYGPTCLKRAVKAGTAPIEALTELNAEMREIKTHRAARSAPVQDSKTMDLFEQLRAAALDDFRMAVSACESMGMRIVFEIKED